MRQFLLYILLFTHALGSAQSYDNDLLTKDFHKGRRQALRKLMPDSSCVVFFTNPERQRANDTKYLYHQDPDFYYLTGLKEPNAVLLMFKEPQTFYDTIVTDEIIFVQDRNPTQEAWTGKILGKDGVKLQLGFDKVLLNSQFADFKIDFSKFQKVFHKEFFDDVRDDKEDRGDLYSLIKHFRLKTEYKRKNLDNFNLEGWMSTLREIKQPEEMVLMRKAIDITCMAHAEMIRALEPGMAEYQAQAVVEYMFKNMGAEYEGYNSIVGGGENSCILHYETNRKKLDGGDLLVVDAGAEYHGYTADVTRTMPMDGKFSEEEKAIYNLVLEAQEAGIKACKSGAEFRASHKAAVAVIQKGLKDLGIIKNSNDFMKYFFHGTSHYLGLDVHDAGNYGRLFPGNVITVEPGIYIPSGSDCDPKWWNIGVRIEDDILITNGEPEVLSGKLPKKVEEIEALMKEESLFNKMTK
ncbi:MAG: aminopeptidase P N-terminal domain-containing protein [Bacteroidetes bacterium]|nr:aminopeptidase P N-terminal domain-containing protein [Bacteroidota bacterium]